MEESRISFEEDKIYHPNLTNDDTLLKNEKTRRKNASTPHEEHENKLWNFLYNIKSFSHLNSARECVIEFNGEKSRIDIVAQSELCRLYIECTTDNSNQKIRQTRDKFYQYNKLISLPKNDANILNQCQIIYLKEKPTPTLIRLLEQRQIIILTENALEYFITLSIEYKKLAYFQFLNFLFEGKEIKGLKSKYRNGQIQIKSLEGKDPHLKDYYLFNAKPCDLIPISTVPHRKMSSIDDGLSKSYQRLIKKKKIQGIQKHIIQDKSFPTNLIVHFNFEDKVNYDGKSIFFTPRFGFINVIDGQHRLFSYIDEWLSSDDIDENSDKLKKFSESHFVTVTAFTKLKKLNKQIETFVSINEKQTPVSNNLLWDLYPELFTKTHEDYYKVKISELVKRLNNDENSKFYFKIKYPSAPYGSKSGPIDLNTICNSIKSNKLYYSSGMTEGELHGLFKVILSIPHDKTDEAIFKAIKLFFETSHEISKDNWGNKFYMTNQYVSSFLKLFKSIIKHLVHEIKKIKTAEDLDQAKVHFKKYLEPAQNYIDQMDQEEMRKFKKGSYGAGGPKGMWLELIKKINKIDEKFEKSEVENKSISEQLEEIFNILRDSGESEILEAKETFFIDADKKRHTGELDSNEEMTKSIIKTIVAMANGKGGEIILGAGDPQNQAYEVWTEVGLNETDMSMSGVNSSHDKYKLKINNKIKGIANDELFQRIKLNTFKSDGNTFCIIEVKQIPKFKLESDSFYNINNVVYYRKNGETSQLNENSRSAHKQDMITELY